MITVNCHVLVNRQVKTLDLGTGDLGLRTWGFNVKQRTVEFYLLPNIVASNYTAHTVLIGQV